MKIPMVDLKVQLANYRHEIEKSLLSVLDSTQFILGPNVQAFEQEAAAYLNAQQAIGVASGTDALHLALRAAGVKKGDEVITTPFTFIATAEVITYLGARPVFVDIEPETFNIDCNLVEKAITPRTKAILPVHLFGQPVDMKDIQSLSRKYQQLKVIEDCAQSFGATFAGQQTGTFGEFGCFSFFPSKNLGGYGDGGLVTTCDDELAEDLRVLRNHGSRRRYVHSVIGFNSRLDEMQAAILRVKLKHIDEFNRCRRENAHYYNEKLQHPAIRTPVEHKNCKHVYHQYTILTENRGAVQEALTKAGIASAVYYPIPLHRQEVYAGDYVEVSLPVAEKMAEKVLSLPIYPELRKEQIDEICDTILAVF